jgi:hypothetical protein
MIKFNKIIYLILFLVQFANAQTNSFYSQNGIGITEYSYSARRLGMGDLGVAIEDKEFISVVNPASWKSIDLTRIEFGASFNYLLAKNNLSNKFFTKNYFSGFTFGFPVSMENGIAFVLGLIPVTRMSYTSLVDYKDPANSLNNYRNEYSGDGGLSKLFIGTSYELPFKLSVGASFDYYFGDLKNNSQITFTNPDINSAVFYNTKKIKGIGGTFGIISPDLNQLIFKIDGFKQINIGLSITSISTLNVDTSFVKRSVYFEDTIYAGSTDMSIPLKIGFGVGAKIGNFYNVYIDFVYQPWKDFKYNKLNNPNFKNSTKLSTGFEYSIPNATDFWNAITWRFGLSFENTPYQIKGQNINQFSVSGGFSIPLSKANTIDIGIQYLSRGTTESNLIKEDLFKLGVGISLGELWFQREER